MLFSTDPQETHPDKQTNYLKPSVNIIMEEVKAEYIIVVRFRTDVEFLSY